MNKKVIIAAVLACVLASGGYYGWQRGHQADPGTLVLNGNVDIRQVSLAFDGSGRVKTLDADAGDTVKGGQAREVEEGIAHVLVHGAAGRRFKVKR